MSNRTVNPHDEWDMDQFAWAAGYNQALEDVMAFFKRNHEKYTARQIEVHFAE